MNKERRRQLGTREKVLGITHERFIYAYIARVKFEL